MADGEAGEGEGEGEEEEEKPKAEKPPPKEYSSGRWRAKASGAVLGEEPVEFTVVRYVMLHHYPLKKRQDSRLTGCDSDVPA